MVEVRRRKADHWGRFLLIWALILLLIGAASCFLLYRYLDVYESTRPEPVVETYLAHHDAEQLISLAQNNIQLNVTEYENAAELYSSYLSTVDTSKSITYRSTKDSDSSSLVYAVTCGNNEICELVLIPDGSSPGFGRHNWIVAEIRSAPITDLLPSVHLIADALAGEPIFLNDKPLTDAYITDSEISISNLNKTEAAMDVKPSFVRYEVGPLYGEIRLSDKQGNTLSPDNEAQDGILHYTASSNTHRLRIRAPEDIIVSVNGVELTSQDIVSSDPGVLKGLDVYTQGAACMTNIYELDGLYMEPTVTAVDASGRPVTPVVGAENTFTFFYPNDASAEEILRPPAERFFNAYMDYSAHAYDVTRYFTLLNCILPRTSLYEYVSASDQAMVWASGTSTEYKDLRYENFHKVSDYCCTCTVIYSADMTATSWYEQYSYSLENAYELAFVSDGGFWYAAGMDVIAGS